MTRRGVRAVVAVPVLGVLGGLLVWAFAGMPSFGHYRGPYGDILNRVAVPQRHTTNVVGATVFDYRGVDTMGEEFILFAAVMGVVLLLRGTGGSGREPEPRDAVRSDAFRHVGVVMVGVVALVGLWLSAFGYVTPGGGFQGGVALSAGAILLYLAGSYRSWRRLTVERAIDPLEGTGAGGYVVVGLAALVAGLPFLKNLLGPGQTGTLFSGGSIAFVNWASALEVAAANILLYREFLEEYVAPVVRSRT